MARGLLTPAVLLFAGLVVLGVSYRTLAMAAGPHSKADDGKVISRLLMRIDDLEKRIAALEAHQGNLFIAPPKGRINFVTPETATVQPSLPKGWSQHEINGIPFYIAPLQAAPQAR